MSPQPSPEIAEAVATIPSQRTEAELWAAFAASCWECGSESPRTDEFFCAACLPGIEAATARAKLRVRLDLAVAAAVGAEREACAATLRDLREWPCEEPDCHTTFGDVADAPCGDETPNEHSPVWFCGKCRDRFGREVRAHERSRLRAAVLAFAENKMHAPWLKDLAAIFDAEVSR